VLQAESDLEQKMVMCDFHSGANLIQQLQQVMCDMLDGRTFGRDDVLWSSQVSDEIERFLQSREKSTFHSEHDVRWPGLCSLYCECFVRAVDNLPTHGEAYYRVR
jgi:hypothetical protein